MSEEGRLSIWLHQIRAPFLILAVVLVLVGIAAARYHGFTQWLHAGLLMIGVVSAHVSVNLFNELSDLRTGIDRHTTRTPFSGGSGMLQSGKTSCRSVTVAAYAAMAVSAAIGVYFWALRGWLILFFMIIGAIAIRFYTPVLARWLLGEFFSGLTLGSFVVLGTYYALAGRLEMGIVLVSVPPGILTAMLLFLNEFPDAAADRMGGRYHLVIHLGKKKSSLVYAFSLIGVYAIITITALLKNMPATILIALFTMPLAAGAVFTVLKHHHDHRKLVPALGMNVGVVILTDLLLAAGYFLG